MLEAKELRQNIDTVKAKLAVRGYELEVDHFNELESERKTLQMQVEELQNQRKNIAKKVGKAKSQGEDIGPLKAEAERINEAFVL